MVDLGYSVNSTARSRSVADPHAERPAVSHSRPKSIAPTPHPQPVVSMEEGTKIVEGEPQGNGFGTRKRQ